MNPDGSEIFDIWLFVSSMVVLAIGALLVETLVWLWRRRR